MRKPPKAFDPSKYGVTLEQWMCLSKAEKRRLREQRQWRIDKVERPERLRARRHQKYHSAKAKDPDIHNRRDREYYRRDMMDPNKRAKWVAKWRASEQRRRSKHIIRHSPDEVYRLVMKAIPSGLPRFVRDDLSGMICLAVLEGKLLVDRIEKEVANFMRTYNREYDTIKTLSLDAPIRGMDGMTYLDRLSGGAGDA
jgi:hypothetical protein